MCPIDVHRKQANRAGGDYIKRVNGNRLLSSLLFLVITYVVSYQSVFTVCGLPPEWRGPILYSLIIVSTMAYLLKVRNKDVIFPREVVLFGIWLIWCLFGFHNVRGNEARELFWLNYRHVVATGLFFFTVAGIIYTTRDVQKVMLGFVIGCVIVLIVTAYCGELFDRPAVGKEARIGTFTVGNANEYAFRMFFGVVAAVYLIKKHKVLTSRSVLTVVMALFLVAIIGTASRKTFIVVIIFLFMHEWHYLKAKCFPVYRKLAFVLIVLCIMWGSWHYLLSGSLLRERFDETDYSVNGIRESEWHRIDRYLETLDIVKEQPLTGLGLGGFIFKFEGIGSSHSEYIAILTETGVIGAILYFGIYVSLCTRLCKAQKMSDKSVAKWDIYFFMVFFICILIINLGRLNYRSYGTYALFGSLVGLYARKHDIQQSVTR